MSPVTGLARLPGRILLSVHMFISILFFYSRIRSRKLACGTFLCATDLQR